jgi:hypothetical protein
MGDISNLVGAIGGIIGMVVVPVLMVWVNSKSKRLDNKIEDERERMESRRKRELLGVSSSYGKIYGYMHKMLYSICCDRVYIIQPHPLSAKHYISISLEVVHAGRDVVEYKDSFQYKVMGEWGGLCGMLSGEGWIVIDSVRGVEDVRFRTELMRKGVKQCVIRRMVTEEGHWEGNLCCEWTHGEIRDIERVKEVMEKKGLLIEMILPEYGI